MAKSIIEANEYTPLPERRIIDRKHGDRLLSEYNGVKTWHSYDEAEKKTRIRYSQDVEPIIDGNIAFQNSHDGYSKSRDLQYVANIPLVVVNKWLVEEGIDIFNKNHAEAVRRKLNDPEYRHLRTGMGRL